MTRCDICEEMGCEDCESCNLGNPCIGCNDFLPPNRCKSNGGCGKVTTMKNDRQISLNAALNSIDANNGILYDNPTLVASLHNLLEALPSAQEWTPCSERLPEKEGLYLCTVQSSIGKTIYLRIVTFKSDIYREYDIEVHKPGFIDYDSKYGFYEVTTVLAWQPLPEAYKGSNND